MNKVTTDYKLLARANAKSMLLGSETFKALSEPEQRSMYKDLVRSEYNKLAGITKPKTAARAMEEEGPTRADRDFDPNFDAAIDGFEDLVQSVDFPQFVSDLLRAVFDANMDVMKTQTEEYIKLLKAATTDLSQFINKIDDTTTFAYLAENQPNKYGIRMERDGERRVMQLTDPEGENMDVDDNEVKKSIMDAKIKMAQEHRTALREVILMGVTRLVVKKGKVKAGVQFNMNSKRDLITSNMNTNETNTSVDGEFSLGGFFSPYKVNGGFTHTSSNISVSTVDSTAEDELKAKLMGEVEIEFMTDYFKLDNFAQMYGPAAQGQAGAPAQQPQLPIGA